MGREVQRMRTLIPLFEGMKLRANLRRLIVAQAVMEAHRQGERVRLPEGAKVRYIPPKQLQEEINVYEDHRADQEREVKSALKEVKLKHTPSPGP